MPNSNTVVGLSEGKALGRAKYDALREAVSASLDTDYEVVDAQGVLRHGADEQLGVVMRMIEGVYQRSQKETQLHELLVESYCMGRSVSECLVGYLEAARDDGDTETVEHVSGGLFELEFLIGNLSLR